MLKNLMIGLLMLSAVIVTIGVVGMHFNERQLYREEVSLTSSDRDYLLAILKKRSADDCIVEPTGYGWKCTDFKGKVYKVIKDESKIKTVRLNSLQNSGYKVVAKGSIDE